MQKIKTDISGAWWPQHLEPFEYEHGRIDFVCFLDYSAPDSSVGYKGGAWLVHAYAGGVDVIDVLKDSVIKEIEREALCSLLRD